MRGARDQAHGRRHKVRSAFFVATGLVGFALAALALSLGVLLDGGSLPIGVWSLVALGLGACFVILASHAASTLYREYRRRYARD